MRLPRQGRAPLAPGDVPRRPSIGRGLGFWWGRGDVCPAKRAASAGGSPAEGATAANRFASGWQSNGAAALCISPTWSPYEHVAGSCNLVTRPNSGLTHAQLQNYMNRVPTALPAKRHLKVDWDTLRMSFLSAVVQIKSLNNSRAVPIRRLAIVVATSAVLDSAHTSVRPRPPAFLIGPHPVAASYAMVKQRKNGGKPRNGVPWWRKLVLPRRGVKDSRLRPAADTPEQVVKLEK